MSTVENVEQLQEMLTLSDQGILGTAGMAMLGLVVAVGLLNCFFGLKIYKFWVAVLGFVFGMALGAGVALRFELDTLIALGIGLVVGILFAVIAFKIYLIGVFLLCFMFGALVTATILQPASLVPAIICLVVGLVVGLISLKIANPIIILMTALNGAVSAGAGIAVLLSLDNIIGYVIMAVLFVAGAVVQFIMLSRKVGKKEVKLAEEVKGQMSVEAEVEAARSIIDEIEKED